MPALFSEGFAFRDGVTTLLRLVMAKAILNS